MKSILQLWLFSLFLGCNACVLPANAQQNLPDSSSDSSSSLTGQNSDPFVGVDVVQFVLDCSKTMQQQITTQRTKTTQFEQAKVLLSEVRKRLPPHVRCGLRVFGNTIPTGIPTVDFTDTTLLIVPNLEKNRIQNELKTLEPMGKSGMLHALLQSEVDLTNEKNTLIVLITSEKDASGCIVEDFVNILKTHKSPLT